MELNGLEAPVLFLLKIVIWIFLALYILFAGIVIKQVRVMTETLQVGFEKPIKALAVVHFLVSVVVFLLSLFIM